MFVGLEVFSTNLLHLLDTKVHILWLFWVKYKSVVKKWISKQQLDVFFDPFVELFLASGRKMGGKTSKEKRMHQISQVAGGKEFWCAMPMLW